MGKETKQSNSLNIEVVDGGKSPIKGSEHAACYDVYARHVTKINSFYYKVKLGIKSEIPVGKHIKLHPRSGITDTGWALANSTGIIDSDFRGEWQARFRAFAPANENEIDFPYIAGDRVAQFEIRTNDDSEIVIVDKVSENTDRGEGGFNSTGSK